MVVDPADTMHRRDHYVPIPRVPYYLEAGHEYSAGEMAAALADAARLCLPSIETGRAFVDRTLAEAASPGRPTR